jgi:hypothetical protein
MKNIFSRQLLFVIAVAGAMALLPGPAFSQFTVNIAFDENCHGTFRNSAGFNQALACSFVNDPGSGGLNNALFYNTLNPPGLIAGDVIIMEGSVLSDVLRFDSQTQGGGVFVYSDTDLPRDMADIGFPTAFLTNTLTVQEVGPEGNNGITYVPTAGQPGFVSGVPTTVVTYQFTSDVPEPATGILLLGGAILLLRRHRRA